MASAVQDNYYDFSALNKIKLKSKSESKEALKSVAAEFETIFLKMMLKSMREANMGDELMGSDSAKFYREMYDDQLALKLSKQGGIGLASTLVEQLGKYLPATAEKDQLKVGDKNVSADARASTNAGTNAGTNASTNASDIAQADKAELIKTPSQFVAKLMPLAESAANEIGVKPKVLLAQAALETGWGKYVVQQANGESSFNLFNIKADNRWSGKNASISTVEYLGNKPQSREASFRVYKSYEDSFKDYVKFLKDSPRYAAALENTHSAEAFTNSLQQAGYATDPMYAKKIQRILGDKPMNEALLNLRNIDQVIPQNNMSRL